MFLPRNLGAHAVQKDPLLSICREVYRRIVVLAVLILSVGISDKLGHVVKISLEFHGELLLSVR